MLDYPIQIIIIVIVIVIIILYALIVEPPPKPPPDAALAGAGSIAVTADAVTGAGLHSDDVLCCWLSLWYISEEPLPTFVVVVVVVKVRAADGGGFWTTALCDRVHPSRSGRAAWTTRHGGGAILQWLITRQTLIKQCSVTSSSSWSLKFAFC